MTARAEKWWATMAVAWQVQATYRLNFVLLILAPALVFFFVKVSLWTSIYRLGGKASIGGFDQSAMLAYQCQVLVVALLSQGWNSVPISDDIRAGRITAHLLHPFGFLEFHTAQWVAFQALQLVVVGVLLVVAVSGGLLPVPAPATLAAGLGFALLVSALWYALNLGLGIAAFWLEETWVLRVMLRDLSVFLSGAMLPLELYPDWLRGALMATPFPYLTWVPAKVLAGDYPDLSQAVLVIAVWTLAAALLDAALWDRGMRSYTAAGM